MATTWASILLAAAAVLAFVLSPSEAAGIERGDFPDVRLHKRPFCNAFTGCGKKRSSRQPTSAVEDLLRKLGRRVVEGSGVGEAPPSGYRDDDGRWSAGQEDRKKRSLVVPRVGSGPRAPSNVVPPW